MGTILVVSASRRAVLGDCRSQARDTGTTIQVARQWPRKGKGPNRPHSPSTHGRVVASPGPGLWRPALHTLWGSPARLPQAFSLLEPSTAITVTLCVPHTAQVPRMMSPEAPLKTRHLFPSLTDPRYLPHSHTSLSTGGHDNSQYETFPT